MKTTLSALRGYIEHASIRGDAGIPVNGVSTDSRQLAPGSLFVALRGERFDAHDFLPTVQEGPVAAVMVERLPDGCRLPALVVPDTRVALGQMAQGWRRRFDLPVIGVTGSNGKTTVKEMIGSILTTAFGDEQVLATRGNLNNDIGVPLTLFRLESAHRAAVIELGMNHPGEIAQLTAIAMPTVGLVNNAQREHQEFMQSVEAVAQENGSVIAGLPPQGVAVFPADDPFSGYWRGLALSASGRRCLTFGLEASADVRCTHAATEFGSRMEVASPAGSFSVALSAAGLHNVRNALAATACALAVGIQPQAIVAGLERFQPVSGRLQRKTAVNGAMVIDDTYNANPDSVRAAVDVLAAFPAPRFLALGDMGEVGEAGQAFHEEIGAYAKARGIESLLTLGTLARFSADAFGPGSEHFTDAESMCGAVAARATPEATVLIKGSRFMRMERVVGRLTGENKQESH